MVEFDSAATGSQWRAVRSSITCPIVLAEDKANCILHHTVCTVWGLIEYEVGTDHCLNQELGQVPSQVQPDFWNLSSSTTNWITIGVQLICCRSAEERNENILYTVSHAESWTQVAQWACPHKMHYRFFYIECFPLRTPLFGWCLFSSDFSFAYLCAACNFHQFGAGSPGYYSVL